MVSPKGKKRALVPFSRDRLFLSVYESCKHRPRAISEAAALTQTIINQLLASNTNGTVGSSEIAKQAHVVLERFDRTAATFYAAYHLQ